MSVIMSKLVLDLLSVILRCEDEMHTRASWSRRLRAWLRSQWIAVVCQGFYFASLCSWLPRALPNHNSASASRLWQNWNHWLRSPWTSIWFQVSPGAAFASHRTCSRRGRSRSLLPTMACLGAGASTLVGLRNNSGTFTNAFTFPSTFLKRNRLYEHKALTYLYRLGFYGF